METVHKYISRRTLILKKKILKSQMAVKLDRILSSHCTTFYFMKQMYSIVQTNDNNCTLFHIFVEI